MDDSVSDFYDQLADDYHLIFGDWDGAVVTQSAVFERLIASRTGGEQHSILDCSCGIGTQSIGLAAAGHRVVASDLSAASVQRAAEEAHRRGVLMPTSVADMRTLPFGDSRFDVVLSVDNALPHLLTESDVHLALSEIRRVLKRQGLFIATIRDYRNARQSMPRCTPPKISADAMTFQLWDWHDDGARYDLRHCQLTGAGQGDWRVRVRRTTYWAVTTDELSTLVAAAGFTHHKWLEPAESGFYQPVLLATA